MIHADETESRPKIGLTNPGSLASMVTHHDRVAGPAPSTHHSEDRRLRSAAPLLLAGDAAH